VLTERNPARQVEALLALTRVTGIDPQHRKPSDSPVDTAMQAKILDALARLDWKKLNHEQQLTLVRTYEICFVRFGRPDAAATNASSGNWIRNSPPRHAAQLAAVRDAGLSPVAHGRDQSHRASEERADAGGANGIRALAPDAEDGLDHRAAHRTVRVVPEGGELPRRRQF
jgi:hypothetical protein